MKKITEETSNDEKVAIAEMMWEQQNYSGAIEQTQKVLNSIIPQIVTCAQAALLQGRSLMTQTLNHMNETGEVPDKDDFEKAWDTYRIAQMVDPESKECKYQLNKITKLLREFPASTPKAVRKADFDVLVVGAGASGIGTALMLTETFGLDKSRVVLMERGSQVGESFRRWPEEMKFISPSFNQQGWTKSFDLNAIFYGTSPAFSLHSEHPSGNEYATYLAGIVKLSKLNVRTQAEVVSIKKIKEHQEHPLFAVDVQYSAEDCDLLKETLTTRYVVWAAGEFQYPKGVTSQTTSGSSTPKEEEKKSDTPEDSDDKRQNDLIGLEHCIHNSQVRSWAKLPGDDFIIIGGYESGCDAAINLSRAGKRCKILASTACWDAKTTDPSSELAPYTASRLREVLASGNAAQPQLYAPIRVLCVEKANEGGFNVTAQWDKKADENVSQEPNLRNLLNSDVKSQAHNGEGGELLVLHTPNPPVLCIGFQGSVAVSARHLFHFAGKNDTPGSDNNNGINDHIQNHNLKAKNENGKNASKGCIAGAPLLTKKDESTKVPGVFLVGPAVSHGSLSFCFIYKFRQRFAVVAKAICEGMGIDVRAAVDECKTANMLLEDLSCCEDTCGDVC